MTQKNLSVWLKVIIGGLVILALIVYGFIVPEAGKTILSGAPEFKSWYLPWLIFSWLTAVPCLIAAIFAWKVADNIGKDRSFSNENALLLKRISILAALEGALIVTGNIVFFLLGMNHPGIVIALFMIAFVPFAVSVACAALSHLVKKAADLQEESDLTI